jgi:hypothetical protein
LVRDPIERCISNYVFHRDQSAKYPGGKDFYSRVGKWIANGELSFIEYLAIEPDMKNVYLNIMKYWSRRRFSLIGTTENYGVFLEKFSDLLGVKFENTIWERKRENTVELTEAELKRARQVLVAEYKWYDEFIKSAAK